MPVKPTMKSNCTLLLLALLGSVSANNISGSDFTCDPSFYDGRPSATNVRNLKPTDIRVIGAMGDSWTSGFRILTEFQNLASEFVDFRGIPWSIGGDGSLSTVTTLPNIIREYTNDLYGYSINTTPTNSTYLASPNTRFNLGSVNGHVSELWFQAQNLVSKMKSDPNIDFENDWKVVTVFAGFNDLCDGCINSPRGEVSTWISNYTTALDYLRDNLPRTFVNVVQLSDLLSLHDAVVEHSVLGDFCRTGLAAICPCGRQGANFTGEDEFRQLNDNYKSRLVELISSPRYHTKDDFTVELQLVLDQFNLTAFSGEGEDPDLTLLASDCLHLSARGNRLLATGLWNNMFQSNGEKQNTLSNDGIFCPMEETSMFVATPLVNISGSDFTCDLNFYDDDIPAKTVHELKPTDIGVIGAMGDSLTSGFRVLTDPQNLLTELLDYRGLSWSVGGDGFLSTVTTLPNILRLYNNSLYGYSQDTTPVQGYLDHSNTRLNLAHLNGHASELLAQAQALVSAIRESDQIDFDNDWKVVTIFVGLNDICDGCINSPRGEPDNWIANYAEGLDYLSENLPRTYVNVIQLLDLFSLMQTVSGHSVIGSACQVGYSIICPCGPFGPSNVGETEFRRINNEYKSRLTELTSNERYHSKDDFTVELQPFLDKFDIGSFGEEGEDPDVSFLASDCLHLSGRGNRFLATVLWNSMFRSGKDKPDTISGEEILYCPTEEQRTFTTFKGLNTGGLNSAGVCSSNVYTVVLLSLLSFLWMWPFERVHV